MNALKNDSTLKGPYTKAEEETGAEKIITPENFSQTCIQWVGSSSLSLWIAYM